MVLREHFVSVMISDGRGSRSDKYRVCNTHREEITSIYKEEQQSAQEEFYRWCY